MNPHDHPTEPMSGGRQEWFPAEAHSEQPRQDQQTSSQQPTTYHLPAYDAPPTGSMHSERRSGVAPRLVGGIAALSLILGGAAGAGAGALVSHNNPGSASSNGSQTAAAPVDQSERVISGDVSNLTIKVVQQVGPAVVSIRNSQAPQQDFFGNTSQAISAGSGVVIDKNGYILTNYHVVADAQNLTVTFANATTAQGTVVGTDQANDIAVIKVDTKVPAVAQFGDSSQLKTGETVIAIGNALGNLQNTVTEGIISGLNRTLPNGNDPTNQESLQNLIQTDAAINHGNSGGPLVDLAGRVIGINTAVVRSSGSSGSILSAGDQAEGLGFAIPSNTAKAVADRLIFHTPSPSLGVSYLPVSPQVSSSYGMPIGALIRTVVPNSAAAKAGLKPQDIITAVDGQKIDDQHDLKSLIDGHHIGDTVKLSVYRSGQSLTITATLGKSTQ